MSEEDFSSAEPSRGATQKAPDVTRASHVKGRLGGMLRITQPPYFLTIVIAILAFQINHFVETTIEQPVIEFDLELKSQKEVHVLDRAAKEHEQVRSPSPADQIGSQTERRFSCLISNISDEAFRDISFHFKFSDLPHGTRHRIRNPEFDVIPPSALSNVEVENYNDRIVEFTFHSLQPGFQYVLRFDTETESSVVDRPDLFISAEDDVVILREASLGTYLVRYRTEINILLFAALVTLLVLYLLGTS